MLFGDKRELYNDHRVMKVIEIDDLIRAELPRCVKTRCGAKGLISLTFPIIGLDLAFELEPKQ